MSNKKNIQDELKSLESCLPVSDSQLFSVPEGYFDGFASSVLAKVKAGEENSSQSELAVISPLLASISKGMPYSLPLFYFEQNEAHSTDFSTDPQLSVLNSIGKVLPYKIPQGYFEALSEQILNKVVQPVSKVVPLFARKWMRVAVAAVVGGALVVGGYQYFNEMQSRNLASNSEDTTQNLVAGNAPAIEREIRKTSTKELHEFIKNIGITVNNTPKSVAVSDDGSNVKELLKDISDTEMETFLSTIPAGDDNLFVTD